MFTIGNQINKGRVPWNKGIPNSGFKRGYTPYNKGIPHTKEWKEMMSVKFSGENNPFYGKKHSAENILMKMSGKNSGNWQGGVSSEYHLIRESTEYKLWREAVLKRDNYKCVQCGLKRGWNKELKMRITIEVDHIKPFALFPELRFAIDNGRCLCVSCHRKTDTWGLNKKYQIAMYA